MTDLIPVGQSWVDIKNMAQVLLSSNFLPKSVDTAQKAVAIMLMSRELGVGPMEGFSKISVIQGKPSVGPELMKAMVHKKLPKAIFRLKHSDFASATFSAARPGDEPVDFTYTIEEAAAMGLTNKDNWKKMPATMLRWRCVSLVCRVVFPDCISGISYTPEELGAAVNDAGEVIEIEATKDSQKKDVPPGVVTVPLENKEVEHPYENKKEPLLCTADQVKWIEANVGKDKHYSREEVKAYILEKYGAKHFRDLNRIDYQEVRSMIDLRAMPTNRASMAKLTKQQEEDANMKIPF